MFVLCSAACLIVTMMLACLIVTMMLTCLMVIDAMHHTVYRAVLAHPPNTINGRFRVTEQGEMITQNFGSTDIAERTLDIYTAAVLAEGFVTHVQPTVQWRAAMDKLAESSCSTYRALLGDPSFVTYFKTATPELELSRLNIGSRPTKRNPSGGIESLRAIPWTFAWTQTRLHLPAWLGVGEALQVYE
jgi:phosphoenolpyruvate carboxylase